MFTDNTQGNTTILHAALLLSVRSYWYFVLQTKKVVVYLLTGSGVDLGTRRDVPGLRDKTSRDSLEKVPGRLETKRQMSRDMSRLL